MIYYPLNLEVTRQRKKKERKKKKNQIFYYIYIYIFMHREREKERERERKRDIMRIKVGLIYLFWYYIKDKLGNENKFKMDVLKIF